MPRPVDPKRREDIAQAAFELLKAQGATRMTMSGIAQALGMKRPTLYWYFKDIGAIFDAVLERILAESAVYVLEHMSGASKHPIDVLIAYMESVHGFFAGREEDLLALVQLWAVGNPNAPGEVLERTRRYFEPRRSALLAVLENGIEAGLVTPCDHEAVLDLISALVDGMLLHRITRKLELAPLHGLIRQTLLEPLRLEHTEKNEP